MGTFEAVQGDPAVRCGPWSGITVSPTRRFSAVTVRTQYVMIAAFLPVVSAVKFRKSVSAGLCVQGYYRPAAASGCFSWNANRLGNSGPVTRCP